MCSGENYCTFFCGISGLATSQTSLLRDAFAGVAVAVYISDDA